MSQRKVAMGLLTRMGRQAHGMECSLPSARLRLSASNESEESAESPGNRGGPTSTSGRQLHAFAQRIHPQAQQQLRGFAAQPAEDPSPQEPSQHNHAPQHEPLSQDVTYHGPLANTHKMLKRVSISNTLIALAAAPAIMYWAEGISYVSRVGLASALVFFGILTTGALHWITHPYVHELHYQAQDQTLHATTTTLLGRKKVTSFKLSDVQPLPWHRPVSTFMANDKYYYIDVYSFPDEELLKKLTPPEDSVPPGYKPDADED